MPDIRFGRFVIPPVKNTQKIIISAMLKSAGLSLTDLVREINTKYPESKTSIQNLNQKLTRGSLRDYELSQIGEICGYELSFIPLDEIYQDDSMGHAIESNNLGIVVFYGSEIKEAVEKYTSLTSSGNVSIEYEIALIYKLQKTYQVTIKHFKFDF